MTSFSSTDTNNNVNENVHENYTVTTTSSVSSFSFHLVPRPESLTPKRCKKIVKYARQRVQCSSGGNIPMIPTTPATPSSMRIITHSQLQLGKLLGEGAFSSVYDIHSVKKKHRKLMHQQQGNLVVKFLRAKLYDNPGLFAASAADIVKEGKILATLCHVNVIRLHAISSSLGVEAYLQQEGRGGCYHDGYFLVLEKLTQTLTTRIQEWQGRHTQLYTDYNSLILLAKQQQQQQRQQQPQQKEDNGSSSIVNTTPSVPSWRKRILWKTSRRSGTQVTDRQGSSSLLSLLSTTSDDVSISSIASSSAAGSYFTSDYFADDDADADAVDADVDAVDDADADHCVCADNDWNTTTTSTINKITQEIAQLVTERIDASVQLAKAIHYLTTQHVMHRDLKPDNIGFDHHGVLKVFDFDIARRCCVPSPSRTNNTLTGSSSTSQYNTRLNDRDRENQTFHYTQKVGSPRYMSPECAKRERYNMKTDVYSYALLLHQLLTLQKPYDDLEDDEYDQLVFYQGVRPVIPVELPRKIQQLLQQSWSPRISTRPTMHTICHILKEERNQLIRVGTPPSLVSPSSPSPSSSFSLLLLSSMSYVSSCSFMAVSDINNNNKKKNKKKEKEEKQKNNLFNIKINNSNTTSSSSSNNNNTKKKNTGRRRRFLRPSSLTLFQRNSGGSNPTNGGGGTTNDPNNNDSVVLGPKVLNNKLSSSSSSSYHHHHGRRRMSRNSSNTTNAKAA